MYNKYEDNRVHQPLILAMFSVYIGGFILYTKLFNGRYTSDDFSVIWDGFVLVIGSIFLTYGIVAFIKDIRVGRNLKGIWREVKNTFLVAFNPSKIHKENSIKKYKNEGIQIFPYNELKKLPVSVDLDFIGGVKTVRLDTKSDDSVTFRIEMKENKYWSPHKHDCIETIVLLHGELYDKLNDIKIERGQLYYNPALRVHDIIAKKDNTIFYVEFKDPFKKWI